MIELLIIALIVTPAALMTGWVWKRLKKEHPDSSGSGPRPAAEPNSDKKKSWSGLAWFAVVVLVIVLILVVRHKNHTVEEIEKQHAVKVARAMETKAAEKWVYQWMLPPGMTVNMANNGTNEVKVLESNTEVLQLQLWDTRANGQEEKVGLLSLRWEGKNLVGDLQKPNGDSGNVYLYVDGAGRWSGNAISKKYKDEGPLHIKLWREY